MPRYYCQEDLSSDQLCVKIVNFFPATEHWFESLSLVFKIFCLHSLSKVKKKNVNNRQLVHFVFVDTFNGLTAFNFPSFTKSFVKAAVSLLFALPTIEMLFSCFYPFISFCWFCTKILSSLESTNVSVLPLFFCRPVIVQLLLLQMPIRMSCSSADFCLLPLLIWCPVSDDALISV